MTGSYQGWSATLAIGLMMLVLCVRMGLLTLRDRHCAACGRLLRGAAVCRCAEPPDDS